MGCNLLFGQHRFELAYEVAGADNVLAEAAQQLDRTSVYQTYIWDLVVGGVLHGDVAIGSQHLLQISLELLPGRICPSCSRQRVEMSGLDAMHELCGFPLGRNHVEPAAGDE